MSRRDPARAATLAIFFATTSMAGATDPIGVAGVAEVRVVEREQSEREQSDATSHSSSSESSVTTATCIIPWFGGCLFELIETRIEEHDASGASSTHERELVNDGRSGVEADAGNGVARANVGSGPERYESESSSSESEESFDRTDYDTNIGFSEEHIDESSSSAAAAAAESRTVTSIGGGAAIDLPVAAATVAAGRERGESSSAHREESNSSTRDEDWYFGIPVYDYRSASSSETDSASTGSWNETVATVAVDAGDGNDVPETNLATVEVSKESRDDTLEESSASDEESSTKVLGSEVIGTDSSADQYERAASSSEAIGAEGSAAGGSATAGGGYRGERSESERSASGSDITRASGAEFGESYEEESASTESVHEVGAGAATADGLAVVSASAFDREHETTNDRTDATHFPGGTIVEQRRTRDEGRSRGAAAAGEVAAVDAAGGASYDDTFSENEDEFLFNGTSLFGFRHRERWHGLAAAGGSEALATGGSSRSGFSETENSLNLGGTRYGERTREASSATHLGAAGVAETSLDAGTRETTYDFGGFRFEIREAWADSSGSLTAPEGGPRVAGWDVGGRSLEVRDGGGATFFETREAHAGGSVIDPAGGADHATGIEFFFAENPDGNGAGGVAVDPDGENALVPLAVPGEAAPIVLEAKAALAVTDPASVFEAEAALAAARDDAEGEADPRGALDGAVRADDEVFTAVMPSAPLADPCSGDAPDPLCAAGPVGCVASAAILRTGEADDDRATSAAPTGDGDEHDERIEEEPAAGARMLSSTCDVVTGARVACGEAAATTVALELPDLPVSIAVEADLVRAEACADAADPENDWQDARLVGLRLTIDGETISVGDSAPNTAFHVGPNVIVSVNEQFERTIEECRSRHGAALRIRASDPDDGIDREVVLGWVSTVACAD